MKRGEWAKIAVESAEDTFRAWLLTREGGCGNCGVWKGERYNGSREARDEDGAGGDGGADANCAVSCKANAGGGFWLDGGDAGFCVTLGEWGDAAEQK